jgi:OPA family glycerol-3-phosphate transporter-like MFS transporter
MGTISDRSKPKIFLPLGLLLAAFVNLLFGFVPALRSNIVTMFIVLFVIGWLNGMGWPPCGRTLVYWFSTNERGTATSIWNCAHNVGGGLMATLANAGIGMMAVVGLSMPSYTGAFILNGIVAAIIAVMAYFLIKNKPQDYDLPPVEEWRDDYATADKKVDEEDYDTKELLLHHVLNNKWLWVICFANIFVYLVRYGVENWVPTYLTEVHHVALGSASASYMWYELAGIPGTIICGWISDKLFKGRRGRAGVVFMLLTTLFVVLYIKATSLAMINFALIAIGFLIYGPVMLIGLQALEFVDKNAAGTAEGLTGLFGYFFGSFSANAVMGWVVDKWSWNGGFTLILASSIIAMILFALTWNVRGQQE